MQETEPIRYFLGANSPKGFYSLYDQLINPETANAIYILKGGAGCGKSTLMRRVAKAAESTGETVEYIHCSGDPDSLDAIVLPDKKAAIVDGTAPHVVEPKFPGVIESYVNLGDCYDRIGLQSVRNEILSCMSGYKDCYKRAYRCLNAAAEITNDMRVILATEQLEEKISKRASGIFKREIIASGTGTGHVTQRFLSAITHQGFLTYISTPFALCKRIYSLVDSYGSAHLMLTHLLSGMIEAHYDVIACPSPLFPDRLVHLIIPELSLAFISAPPGTDFPKHPYRRIHLDPMVDPDLLKQNKARLRFSRRVSSALIDEAVTSLSQAKTMHDNLESIYNPHVDFDRVNRIADHLSRAILEQ